MSRSSRRNAVKLRSGISILVVAAVSHQAEPDSDRGRQEHRGVKRGPDPGNCKRCEMKHGFPLPGARRPGKGEKEVPSSASHGDAQPPRFASDGIFPVRPRVAPRPGVPCLAGRAPSSVRAARGLVTVRVALTAEAERIPTVADCRAYCRLLRADCMKSRGLGSFPQTWWDLRKDTSLADDRSITQPPHLSPD